ncbi:MAG TPA: GNAT family N-acetyltransferase [Gemmatimonadaceae bacterium]
MPAVSRLFDAYRQFYGQPADLPRAERFIAERLRLGDSVIITASSSGNGADSGLGFVQLYPSLSSVNTARILILNDLFVVKPARQCGVALALMDEARRYAGSIAACRIELATGKENAPAQRLYRKLGYEPTREFEAFSLRLSGIDG